MSGKKNKDGGKPKKPAVDLTFGLKNKNKSAKVQQYAKQVQANQANAGISAAEAKRLKAIKDAKEAKKLEKALKEEARALVKPILASGSAAAAAAEPGEGGDPKNSVCKFFLQGSCARGAKCKFSHNAAQTRGQKLNLYVDPRDQDTMDSWDQKKLEEVVELNDQKKRPNQTEIVCKYFLEAIENSKYGWKWKCPNGDNCIYRHRLPQGFVFRPKGAVVEKVEEEIPFEERIEEDRRKLDLSKCTPVTEASFKVWFAKQQAKKADAIEQERKKAAKKAGNRGVNVMSGHALFHFDRSLFSGQTLEEGEGEVDYDMGQDEGDEEGGDEEKNADDNQDNQNVGQAAAEAASSAEPAEPSSAANGPINAALFLSDDLDDL